MEKKVLKIYETPATEVVEIEIENQILAGSTEGNADGIEEEELTEG